MGMHTGAVGGAWYKSNGILNSMAIEEECFISLKLYISISPHVQISLVRQNSVLGHPFSISVRHVIAITFIPSSIMIYTDFLLAKCSPNARPKFQST